MEENKHITIAVYSCLYGKEDKKVLRQRQNKTLFDQIGSTESSLGEQPFDSIQLMEETCTIELPEVEFLTYQKYSDDLEYDYEVQIVIDTHLINEIETSQRNTTISDNLMLEEYQTEHDELNELLLPYKRGIVVDNIKLTNIPTDLRTRCLLMPIKLTNNWTLMWIKFSKFQKLFEMIQISSLSDDSDKLSFRSQQFIKWTISDLLSLENHNDLFYNFEYVKMHTNDQPEDLSTIRTLQRILKGYQDCGFNVSMQILPELSHDEMQGPSKSTRTRTLPLLELENIQEINSLYLKRRSKSNLPTPPPTRETKKRPAELKMKVNFNTDGDGNLVKSLPAAKKARASTDTGVKPKRGRKPRDQIIMKVAPNGNHAYVGDYDKKVYVTLENLNSIKENIDYDNKEMEELVELYTKTYDHVEAMLLDKWSKAKEFSKNIPPDFEPPFLIYGPSQIEFEILKADGIIATNSLKQKIKKYDVILSTKTMRSLTSSRRWINQRFKFDPKLEEVFYTRDTNLIIPDYRDIPYIVIATHVHYSHMNADDTFEVTHKNWYISRKMVQFIVGKCTKCSQPPPEQTTQKVLHQTTQRQDLPQETTTNATADRTTETAVS